jgi:heme/copper-type cytochrome/quinol oxidase subunit 1
MYTLVRRFIKTGIGFLALGLALGVFLLVRRELLGIWPNPYLVSAHAHAVLLGFVMFLILGVGLWLFPRAAAGDARYTPARAELAYWLLTASTAGRLLGEVLRSGLRDRWLAWIVVLGGLGQAAGLLVYFWNIWPRIRPVGSQVREARGERF